MPEQPCSCSEFLPSPASPRSPSRPSRSQPPCLAPSRRKGRLGPPWLDSPTRPRRRGSPQGRRRMSRMSRYRAETSRASHIGDVGDCIRNGFGVGKRNAMCGSTSAARSCIPIMSPRLSSLLTQKGSHLHAAEDVGGGHAVRVMVVTREFLRVGALRL